MKNHNEKLKKKISMSDTKLQQVKKIVDEFFKKMTFDVEAQAEEKSEDSFAVFVKTPDAQILIGRGGGTLVELQQILSRILQKQIGEERVRLHLDINNYREDRAQYLKDSAQDLADRAVARRADEFLPAMSSYERLIVHTELAGRDDVKTESEGEGPDRRIIIKPK